MDRQMLYFRRNRLIVALVQTFFESLHVLRNRSIYSFSPNWIKRRHLLYLVKENRISQFIESGTYLGQTCRLIARKFPDTLVDTIEVDENLFNYLRHSEKGKDSNIRYWKGDSRVVLKELLDIRFHDRTLFWLDGHYSQGITSSGLSETPLFDELSIIQDYLQNSNAKCMIVIDDVNNLDKNPNYPTNTFIKDFAFSNDFVMLKFQNIFVLKPKAWN